MLVYVKDFLTWLFAVANNWGGYFTGGIIIAVLSLWSYLRQKSLPKKFAIGLALFFLIVALFNAWEEQYKRAELRNIGLEGEVQQDVAASEKPVNVAFAMVLLDIKNVGERPTAAEIENIENTCSNGKPVKATTWVFPPKKVLSGIADGLGVPMEFFDAGPIYAKISRPIQPGAFARGWLTLEFPGHADANDLMQAGCVLTMDIKDIWGKRYPVRKEWNGTKTRPAYFPPSD